LVANRNRAISLREKAILGPAQKCPYHVTFNNNNNNNTNIQICKAPYAKLQRRFIRLTLYQSLDLDLEHMLDVGSPIDHRVQVWSQSTICLREEAILGPEQKCPIT